MAITSISPELAQIALERIDGFDFESFAQNFLSALEGREFVPLGGVGDGGADGLYGSSDTSFYQFTRQENHRDKIRKTIKRLRDFGRQVKTLYYLSSHLIPHIDKEEELLTDELSAVIKIRDRKYILSHINDSIGTIAASSNYLLPCVSYLSTILKQETAPFTSPHVKNPAAYVFLQHEVTNRLDNRKLVHSVADSLILWSLSDTDPDKGLFKSEQEIHDAIFNAFPWSKQLLKGLIRPRLEEMRNKSVGGREVRWYKKSGQYCLPYETRKLITEESSLDEASQIKFLEDIKLIAAEIIDADGGEYKTLADLSLQTIHMVFEKQGLLFSHFIDSNGDGGHPPVVADCIDEILKKENISANSQEQYRENLEKIIRQIFYNGSPTQREYLSNLSRTYVLLFTLQAEPRVVEYFSTMNASFDLYIGSDIIVQALSERYVPEEQQNARNLLRLASTAGVSLHLSQCALEEVYTHIRGTYFEFRNYFSEIEPYVTQEIARNSDKILIRSYFYAKKEGKIDGWKKFLGNFISYDRILSSEGMEELRKYLVAEYNAVYVDNEELESVSDSLKVSELSNKLLEADIKENEALAYNTALLVHGIYGLRRKNGETRGASEFGLNTWWVTNQSRVLKYTADLIQKNSAPYVMRPDFLLNFLSLSPAYGDARNHFLNILPSSLGIQLGHRLREDVFHQIMDSVKQWKDLEAGRVSALMSSLSDKLKSDRLKRYQRTLHDPLDIFSEGHSI